MADICEVCLKSLKHWEDGIPYYDEVVLCSECSEKVEEISDKHEGKKDFEECVREVRRKKNRKIRK